MRSCVVVVNYKNSDETGKCLASLAESAVQVQAVVVDNSPNDPELEAALSPFTDVHLIRAPENLGFGLGNNLGIDWALQHQDYEFVLILNNDATIDPDAIDLLEAAMDTHPEAGIVTARIVLAEDESKLWYGGGEVDWRRGGGRVPGVLGPANAPMAMQARHVSFASGCAMMIRRNVLQDLGGFDKRFFMYEEDLELSLRVQEAGWKIWYEPNSVIKHLGQGSLRREGEKFTGLLWSSNPNLPFYVFHIIKNRLDNMSMHAHGKDRMVFFTFFPLLLMRLMTRFLLTNRWDAVKALFRALQEFIASKALR